MRGIKDGIADTQHGADAVIVITDAGNTPAEPGVEIRVHGVGDHAPFSALGRPGFEDHTSQVLICEPPQLPRHKLLLIAWSRANRTLTRTVPWYLLLPFTLINVAGYMAPRHRVYGPLVRFSARVVSVLLTMALAAWVTVIVETIWRALTDSPDGRLTRLLLCASGPVVVTAVILKRMIRGDRAVDKAQPQCSVCHLIGLGAVMFVCYLGPANWHYPAPTEPTWLRSTHDSMVDPMTYLLAGTTGTALVLSLILSAIAVLTRRRERDSWSMRTGSSLAGAALLLLVATAVLHTAGSLLRLVAAYVMGLVQTIRHTVTERTQSQAYMLLPQPDDLTEALRMDLLFGFFLAFAAIFTIAIGAAFLISRATPAAPEAAETEPPTSPQSQPMSGWHELLSQAPSFLSFVVCLSVLFTGFTWIAMGLLLDNMSQDAISLSKKIVTIIAIVLFATLVIRRPEVIGNRLKSIFQMIADIAGFWSPDTVPLAGASYRKVLMEGVDAALNAATEGPVALVGHSQGSVICAWYVCHMERRQDSVTLFTCGSPLWSLYATFFPNAFDAKFFTKAAEKSRHGQWYNYWRLTDPIATELPVPVRNFDVTEKVEQPRRGHSEYWREPDLRSAIASVLNVPWPPDAERSVELLTHQGGEHVQKEPAIRG